MGPRAHITGHVAREPPPSLSGAHGPGPPGNRATPLRLSAPSTDEGKAEASFPLPREKASKFSDKKELKSSLFGKKRKKELDSERSGIRALLD